MDAYSWVGLGYSLALLDRPAEAAEAYARTLLLDPTHPDAHYWRGRALARAWLTSPTHSEEERQAIDADPDAQDIRVWLDEAWAHESRRERDAALRGAEEALRRDPANTNALGLKMRVLLQRRRFRDAFAAYRQRLAYDREVIRARREARRNERLAQDSVIQEQETSGGSTGNARD